MSAPTIPVESVFDRPSAVQTPAESERPNVAGNTDGWRRWLRWPRANPILRRELRVRMRGRRAFVVLGAYLLLLGIVAYATEQVLVHADNSYQLQSFQVGQILFAGLAIFEITILIFVAPALTATAISAERERGTFDLLRATPVRPHTLVWGKLVAALSYAALLIVASIPLASAIFLFGGVAPADVWATFALLGITTLAFGMLGLFCSAVARRTGLAAILAYGATALLVVGTIGLYVFLDAVDGGLVDSSAMGPMPMPDMGMAEGGMVVAADGQAVSEADEPPRLLLALNPVLAMASLVGEAVDENPDPWSGGSGRIPVFGDWLEFFRVGDAAFDRFLVFDARGQPVQTEPVDERPLWHLTAAVYGGASLVLFLATVWVVGRSAGQRLRLRAPRPRLRRRRRSALPV